MSVSSKSGFQALAEHSDGEVLAKRVGGLCPGLSDPGKAGRPPGVGSSPPLPTTLAQGGESQGLTGERTGAPLASLAAPQLPVAPGHGPENRGRLTPCPSRSATPLQATRDTCRKHPQALVVTADLAAQVALSRLLESLLFRATVAASCHEALALLAEPDARENYELVVVDHDVPGMDGPGFADQVRRLRGPGVSPRILLLAGEGDPTAAVAAREGRVDAVVGKPASPSSLLDAIDRSSAGRGSGGQNLGNRVGSGERTPPDLTGCRILLAVDNAVTRAVVGGLLRATGCEVAVAADSAEAVARATERSFSLMLMDVGVPTMDGFEVCTRIRTWEQEAGCALVPEGGKQAEAARLSPRLPIVALIAGPLVEDHQRFLQAGMDDSLSEPVGPCELFRTLARWLPCGQQTPVAADGAGESPAENRSCPGPTAGLDQVAAVARLGGDRPQYLRVLRRFAADSQIAPAALRAAWETGSIQTLRRLTHTLKGLAGTIGAEALLPVARDLDAALKDDQNDAVPGLLDALAMPYAEVLASIESLCPEQPASDAAEAARPVAAASAMGLAPLFARLADLLADSDSSASEWVDQIAQAGVPQPGQALLGELKDAVDNYDFDEALARLAAMSASLGIAKGQKRNG